MGHDNGIAFTRPLLHKEQLERGIETMEGRDAEAANPPSVISADSGLDQSVSDASAPISPGAQASVTNTTNNDEAYIEDPLATRPRKSVVEPPAEKVLNEIVREIPMDGVYIPENSFVGATEPDAFGGVSFGDVGWGLTDDGPADSEDCIEPLASGAKGKNDHTAVGNEDVLKEFEKPTLDEAKCTKCEKPPASSMARDQIEHISKHIVGLQRYQCGVCPAKFISEVKCANHFLKTHNKEVAATPKDLMNDDLKKVYERVTTECLPDAVQVVLEWCETTLAWDNEEAFNRCLKNRLVCSLCKIEVQSNHKNVLKHINTHINQKPWFCSLCKFASGSSVSIRHHIAVKHLHADKSAPIEISKNTSAIFLKELKAACAMCFPAIEKQILANLSYVFRVRFDPTERAAQECEQGRMLHALKQDKKATTVAAVAEDPIQNRPNRKRKTAEKAEASSSREIDNESIEMEPRSSDTSGLLDESVASRRGKGKNSKRKASLDESLETPRGDGGSQLPQAGPKRKRKAAAASSSKAAQTGNVSVLQETDQLVDTAISPMVPSAAVPFVCPPPLVIFDPLSFSDREEALRRL
ncbi:unnamed protein product, partial [Mesorhabditis spiculigera]